MDDETVATRRIREPSYADAIIPVVTLAVLIGGSVFLFGTAAIDGPLQVGLILSSVVAALIILKNGHAWDDITKAEQKAVSSVITAIFILLAVGALIGAWNLSVPSRPWPTMAFNYSNHATCSWRPPSSVD
jgi:Na+:H+ antiporter, NhaC family